MENKQMERQPRYVDVDRSLFPKAAGKETVATFIYYENVYADGELHTYSDGARVTAYGGKMYVPMELFTKFLGALDDEAAKTITKDGKTFSYRDSVKVSKGVSYLPALATAEAFGLSARVFLRKLFVIGEQSLLDAIDKDEHLRESALYTMTGVYTTEHLTSEDFTALKNKWRRNLLGDEKTNDMSDPDVVEKVEAVAALGRSSQASRNTAPDRVILWGTEAPTLSNELTAQYNHILNMSLAYGTYGAKTYRDEKLKDDILDSLEWMYENMYGEAIIEGRGWRNPHLHNWWDWFCGGAGRMAKSILIMEEFLDMPTKEKYFRCLKYIWTIHRVGYRADFASSRSTGGWPMALLLEDRELLYDMFIDYDLCLEDGTTPVKGKYTDYCCWEHNYPYNMMYGLGCISTISDATLFVGSPARFKSPKEYEFAELVKYMYEPACYRGQGFVIFNGRGNMGLEAYCGAVICNNMLRILGFYSEEDDLHFKKMIKRYCTHPDVLKDLKKMCSLINLSLLNSILADESISSENDYELTYAWYTADRIAQHKPNYAFMLAMSSERHPSYESINSRNKRGWRTGDGALYFYTDTDRSSFDGVNFMTNYEITKRLPGTTFDAREMQEWSYCSGWKSTSDYAGCMDMYSSFGIGAFDYAAYHYDGHEADGTIDDGYGGDHVYYENDLVAKKSYFFFDEEVLCLGAGINSTMNSPVRTNVEHRRLVKPSGEEIKVDTRSMPKDEFTDVSECKSVYVEGFAGYLFPEGGKIETKRYYRKRIIKPDYHYFKEEFCDGEEYCAEINILHGENPKDGKYAYIILPYATPETIKAYEEAPRVEILENSPACQAARKPSAGVTMMALYEPCCRFGVESDIPAIIMLGERDGLLSFSACDPTQKKACATYTLTGDFELVSASPELTVKIENGRAILTADLRELAGKNLVAELKRK